MNNTLEMLNNSNIIIGALICLFGGIVASFSPCSISGITLIMGYIAKTRDSKNTFKYSIIFAFGSMFTFVILGIIFIIIGKRIGIYNKVIEVILAIILILVSLNLFGVIKDKKSCKIPKFKKNLFTAFTLGILGGLISSPCTAPILIAILTFVSIQGNFLTGIIFMIAYSVGSSVIILFAGNSVCLIQKISTNAKYEKIGNILKIILGVLILSLALYILYGIF